MEFPLESQTQVVKVNSFSFERIKLYILIFVLSFLIISIPVALVIINNGIYQVKNLQISNLTGKSASITWETDQPTYTRVKYREGTNLGLSDRLSQTAIFDDRDTLTNQIKRRTHIVTLNNLNPSTTYYFSIGEDIVPATADINALTSFPISSRIESPQPIYGQVNLASGLTNFDDVIVHYFVHDPQAETFSAVYSAIPNKDGKWAGEVTSIRNNIGAMYFGEGEISAIVNKKESSLPSNVLGIDSEGNTSDGGSANEYVQVSASNGQALDTNFVPLSNSLTTEIISNNVNDIHGDASAGTSYTNMYSANYQTLGSWCSSKGTYALNSCTNSKCQTGLNCSLTDITDYSWTLCLSRTTSSDQIMDCCASGYKIVGGKCVSSAAPSPTPVACNYGANPLYSCPYEVCPSGHECAQQSLQNAGVAKCLKRSDKDYINDCCATGYKIVSGKCTPIVNSPTPTPVPVVTCNYGANPKNTCNYEACPSGRYCAAKSLQNAGVVWCLDRTDKDYIYDCCAADYIINGNGKCVAAPNTPTPTQKPANTYTPTPTPVHQCVYGDNPLNTCSEYTPCGTGYNCVPNALQNAAKKMCLARSSKDVIADCCEIGYKIDPSTGTSCIPEVATPTPTITTNPVYTSTPTPTPTITLTPTVAPTNPPTNLNGCVALWKSTTAEEQALGQRLLDEQIIPYISSSSGYPPVKITLQLVDLSSGGCSSYNKGYINCNKPNNDLPWLTNKLLFHEAMHQFQKYYVPEGTNDQVTSELMASMMETTYVQETCMGGEYSFYGLGDNDKKMPRKSDQIRNNSGLSASQLWSFAITGVKDAFTDSVVNRIVPGAWKYTHIFCNGYKHWATMHDGSCGSDQLANIPSTFNVSLGIDLSPNKINDFTEGQYRLDLKYKTLTSSNNEADVTVPVKLSTQPACAPNDAQCQINNVGLPSMYVDKNNSNDPRYYLNVSLNSDIKNDLNCWNTSTDLSSGTPPTGTINKELNLQDMKCDYSFGNNPIGGSCNLADLKATGIVAPWQLVSGAIQSTPYSSSHPGVDVQGTQGDPLVSAGDGVVIYTRRGDVKDSIYFDQEKYGTRCEEGSRLDSNKWLCVCDWCPMDKVIAGAAKRTDLCNGQRDCVARAQALQNSSPDWASDGAIHRIYGNVVIIQHGGHKTVYGHMSSVAVNTGDCVTAGQTIGNIGTTGSSSGTHVHFEVRSDGGTIINPGDFKCNGDKCNQLYSILPNKINGLPNYLGVSTDENPDFMDGDLQLTDSTASSLSQGIYKVTSPAILSKNLVVKDAASTPKFYVDSNKNGKFDVGEQELGAGVLSTQFSQVASLEGVSLNQNWNLVSFNSLNKSTATTKDLADQAELSGLKVEMASYDTDLWTISALKKEGNINAFYGNMYNLVPGKAFFLKTDSSGIYYNSGQLFNNINKDLALNIGWNFFSFSQDVISSATLTSYSLLDKCKDAGITCTLFSDYNGQLDNTVLVKDMYYGKDYPLVSNKGYILKVDANPGTIKF